MRPDHANQWSNAVQQITPRQHRPYAIWSIVFGVLLAAALYALLGGSAPAAAAGKPASGTVPSITRFHAGVSPNPAAPGQLVFYMLEFATTDPSYVDVTLAISSELPADVQIIPDTVTTTVGYVGWDSGGNITWEGSLYEPQAVLITFLARVSPAVCKPPAPLTSRFTLHEIYNPGAGGPSDQMLIAQAQLEIDSECHLYLPTALRSLEPIKPLANWDFEAGPVGWTQLDNGQPVRLIYSTDANRLPMPQGGRWFGWLGGLPNKESAISQLLRLPADHSGLELRFLYWIASDGACGLNLDVGTVLLNNQEIADAPFLLCAPNNTNGWRTARIVIPPQYRGASVYLSLNSRTDGFQISNWYIDNVRLCSSDPRAAQADRCE